MICDRYSYSGVAFSSAGGLGPEWCKQADRGLLRPDIVLFLDVSAEEASTRLGYGSEVYENVEFQTKVEREFARLGRDEPRWVDIDASQPQDAVAESIWTEVDRMLRSPSGPLVFDLWFPDV